MITRGTSRTGSYTTSPDAASSPVEVGAPGMIRTCGLLLRRQTLYPLSYGRGPDHEL